MRRTSGLKKSPDSSAITRKLRNGLAALFLVLSGSGCSTSPGPADKPNVPQADPMGSPRSEAGIEDQAFAPTIEALTAPTGRPEPVAGLKTNEALARWISRWAQQLQACNADKSALAMLLMERTMPAGFEKCAQNGGRVRRISGPNKEHGLSEGEYVDYCYKDGESYRGEVKTKDGASDKEGGDPSPPTSSRSSGMKPGKGPGGGMPMPPS